MTFVEVFRFEVEYRLRQPSTWVYALVLFGIPFLMMHAIDGATYYLNAPSAVANISAVMGGIAMLVTAGIFGDAAARDVHLRMHSLFYTSPIQKTPYLGARFLGALVMNGVLAMGVPLGLLIASVMPYMSEGKFGPVQIMAYVQAYLLVLLPNVVIIGAFMFAAAAITRQALATYLGGIVLFASSTIAGDVVSGLSSSMPAILADPFGGRAMEDVTQFWTPAETNSRLLGWPTVILLNRALWFAISASVFGLMLARFRFAHPGGAGRRWWRRRHVVDTAPDRVALIDAPHAPTSGRSFSFSARVRQTFEVASRLWREIAITRAFLVILVGALLLVFAVGWDVGTQLFGTSTWPVTHLIAASVLSTVIGPVMAVLIAIFAGELVWRERDVRLNDIAAVAPIPNGVALLGRFLALVAMLVTLQAVLMGAGVLLQAIRGYNRFELDVYLKILFGIKLVDYILFAALAMAVHAIVNHKYVGHLIVVLFFAYTKVAGLMGVGHSLFVFGSDPGWVWSDMNGLAPFVEGLVWYKLYWAAWALLFVVLASLFWVRGRDQELRQRFALARKRLAGPALRASALAITLIVVLGGFVFYNTNVVNEYQTVDEQIAMLVEYEKRYAQYKDAQEPSLVKAQMRVEFYPQDRAAEMSGTFRLVNRTAKVIDTLHMVLSDQVATRELKFDRDSRLVVDDSAMRHRIYTLATPLAPGDTIAMTFDVEYRPRGFLSAGAATTVTANGAYLNVLWVPSFGYQAGRELKDPELRRKHGLPPRDLPPSAGDVETRKDEHFVQLVDAETIIGTDSAQTAVTPGRLVREWYESGRRYFHYRTDEPIRYSGAVLSAEYAVREKTWNGLPLRIYFHPGHDINVDRMLRSMQSSLAYYTKQFGPYQYQELRIVEFPRYATNVTAHPHTIAFSEGGAFLTRIDSGEVDRTFFVVAHETAHQWWGGQVIPAQAAGAALLSESLAQYSSMMVLEKEYGVEMAREFRDYLMQEYFRGRTVFTNREAPLLDIVNQPYLHYFKGGVVMYGLRETIGEDAVNSALRQFLAKYGGANASPATSRGLYAELQAVTPDSLKPLLSDLFETITLWDVKADSAKSERIGSDYRVTLYVDAAKMRGDSVGNTTPIEMGDLVEIGVFAGAPTDNSPGEPLYLKQHRIRSGKQAIVITVPRQPSRAGIDPFRTVIEREKSDNFGEIAVGAGNGGGK